MPKQSIFSFSGWIILRAFYSHCFLFTWAECWISSAAMLSLHCNWSDQHWIYLFPKLNIYLIFWNGLDAGTAIIYFMYWSSLLLIGSPINKARGSHQVWRVLNILHILSWRFMSMQWPDPLPSLVLQPTCCWKSDGSLWVPVDPCGSPFSLNQCCP